MRIRQYAREDYPKFLEFIRAVYNEQVYKKTVLRFKWQFEQNPSNPSKDPLIFVLEKDTQIIGMIAATAQTVKIGDKNYLAYWVGDHMVHPDFRLGHNGIKLAKTMIVQPFILLGFPRDYLTKLWFRVGAKEFNQLSGYSRNTCQEIEKNLQTNIKIINRCVKGLCRYSEYLFDHLTHRNPDGIKIVDIQCFDERFDRLWEKASKDYIAIQARDCQFLNWRFFQCPYLSYHVMAATKKNEIVGYIVLRDEYRNNVHEGSFVDLFAGKSDIPVLKALIHAAIQDLKIKGCDAITMTISSKDEVLGELLKEFSFNFSENKGNGVMINNLNNDLNPMIQDPSHWFLTATDSDMEFS